MARSFFRGPRSTEPRRFTASRLVAAPVLAILPVLGGCATYDYEPAPIEVQRILADLGARRWHPPAVAEGGETMAAGPRQLAAFAITHNPALRAHRARIGTAQALLVEAGLLADPEIGWDGMNVLASLILDGGSPPADTLSGLGISITLPRPGELDAQKGAARWRVEEARRQVMQAEWMLTREVYVASEDILEAERLLQQNQNLYEVAETTRDYFERARAAGAATAIQGNLASGGLLEIRSQRVRLEFQLREVRYRLNALLGLPPATMVPVFTAVPEDIGQLDAEALVERSVAMRPDLAVLLATYQAAEEELRLEVARQFPQFLVGTGIWFVPGVFTDFNRWAVETAMARRDALGREIEAQLHELRREIHDAYVSVKESAIELDFLESELLPNAEESLRLTGQAFDAGEVTLLEILTLQRVLVDARTRTTEARAELQRRRWRLLSASGMLLAANAAEDLTEDDQGSPVR